MATWPTAALSKTSVDADSDTVTGVSGGRAQLEDAIDRLNALNAIKVEILDEIQTRTAKLTATVQSIPLELRAAVASGVEIGLHANHSTPGSRTGKIGFSNATLLRIINEVTNGDIDFVTNGTGKVKINGKEIVGVPVGMVAAFMTSTAPAGWLACDGSAVSRTTFDELFANISTMYGNGNGSTTFNLPDFRGEFLRGFDNTAGNDPDAANRTDRGDGTTGDNVGTKQVDQFKSHSHSSAINLGTLENGVNTGGVNSGSTGLTGGNETRPRNVYVLWCIKT